MADKKITERIPVVPKADVDRMFEALYFHVPRNSMAARTLRGIAYQGTFSADRTHYIVEPD